MPRIVSFSTLDAGSKASSERAHEEDLDERDSHEVRQEKVGEEEEGLHEVHQEKAAEEEKRQEKRQGEELMKATIKDVLRVIRFEVCMKRTQESVCPRLGLKKSLNKLIAEERDEDLKRMIVVECMVPVSHYAIRTARDVQ